jgi:hypothetical protein
LKKIFEFFFIIFLCLILNSGSKDSGKLNRYELVRCNFPGVTAPDSLSPFTVGIGEFAFMADVTGLQTFPGYCEKGFPWELSLNGDLS